MSHYQLLNNSTHHNLRVITHHSKAFGDNVASSLTFPTEFADVQREYPILLRKDPQTGEFCSVAIFGLQENENLFLLNDKWNANYIPAIIARGPFLIGMQNQQSIGGEEKALVINVDMHDPRVSHTEGENVFHPDSSNSAYLERVNSLLLSIHQGIEFSKRMFESLLELDLIEPVNIEIQLDNGKNINLQGNYTIHQEKLLALPGEALTQLNKNGYLQAAFMLIASLGNIKKLIAMKNAQNLNQINSD